MDLERVGMTQVWSEEVRTSMLTSRWTSSRTTVGTSGSTTEVLREYMTLRGKLQDYSSLFELDICKCESSLFSWLLVLVDSKADIKWDYRLQTTH